MVDFRVISCLSDLVIRNRYAGNPEDVMWSSTAFEYGIVSTCGEVMISQIFHDLYINMTQGFFKI